MKKKCYIYCLFLIFFFNYSYLKAEIPVIVIAPSKKVQSISTVGTSVTVLDENFFKNSNEFFLGDILSQNTTSTNFFQSGGHGTASAIQLRGLPKRYTNVYIDGVKISDPSTSDNAFYFNNLTTNSIKQVEEFSKYLPIDNIIVNKMDGTAKGGIVLSLLQNLEIPVSFLGVGESYRDIIPFNLDNYLNSMVEDK